MEKRDEVRTIPAFEHENALMHYGRVNKRSMITHIVSCVTFILIVLIFVIGYTIRETQREKDWLDALSKIIPSISEVADDGVHKQPDP